ncbi:MAG: acetylglutamate kinase [Bacteroidaceae bacterium]|nr:acetylglutamate kinase [Bacteroidaceae bacterium]
MEPINVIKVGGAVVEDEASLYLLLREFSSLPGHKILVHGGGRSATRLSARLGIESRMVNGRRVTDEETLRVVTMVYGGLVNKSLVARLQGLGVNALGLTGADINIIRSHRRPPKEVLMPDGTREVVDFGYVGDIDKVDGSMLGLLIKQGIVPVIAPLTYDGQGHLLNTNADTMASEVTCALASQGYSVTLTYCFEKRGVLRDAQDEDSVIPQMNEKEFRELARQGIVSDGMIPKLENAFQALRRGTERVIITRSDHLNDSGTLLVLSYAESS